jgi:hypothetical protein
MKGKRVWTPEMLARAKELKSWGWSMLAIDKHLGRAPGSTAVKLNYEQSRITVSDHNVTSFRAPPEALADRDARRAAADLRDFTATHCGDPPPGYSAYDRARRAADIPDPIIDAPIRGISATITLRRSY